MFIFILNVIISNNQECLRDYVDESNNESDGEQKQNEDKEEDGNRYDLNKIKNSNIIILNKND